MKALGNQTLAFDELQEKNLTIPENTILAEIVMEAGNRAEISARFTENGEAPTAENGLPLNHLSILEVKGANLQNFQVIGIHTGITHFLKIEYFG
ncbi:MAG: hypothetical protein CMO01_30510 [Thalassobius sp.]|nr:hypothetical protein [Thalassovita sp.]